MQYHFHFFCLTAFLLSATVRAEFSPQSIRQLSLDDLINVKIVSVKKSDEKLSDSAAAVFVLTGEDIRRSAASNIPDLLRMVPGVQVAQINANAYAVSIRGFNSSFSNKLLVMIDGRTMYTPDFSGVYWEMLDMPLDDIARIEVVRGPGGALWGTNAVNGIINIITKSAENAAGGLLSAGGGEHETGFTNLRYGGKLGSLAHYRVSLRWSARDDFAPQNPIETPISDHWDNHQLSARLDGGTSSGGLYNLQAGLSDIRIGEDQLEYWVTHIDEQNRYVLGKWTQHISNTSQWSLQGYFDYKKRDDQSLFAIVTRTQDLEFQHQFVRANHAWLWGVGYRRLHMNTPYTTFFEFDPQQRTENLFNVFAQDSLTFQTWTLTFGSKFEHHYATGWEVQPSIRARWSPTTRNTFWAAISRAVRTPSRFNSDSHTERGPTPEEESKYAPYDYQVIRNSTPDLQAETVLAYELGNRYRFGDALSFDSAVFFNHYEKLTALNEHMLFDQTTGYTHLLQLQNGMRGDSYGLELATNWVPRQDWRISAAYTWLKLDIQAESGVTTFYDASVETRAPRHQFSLRSNLRLPREVELDVWLRYTDQLPEPNISDDDVYLVERYTTVDARLAWHPFPSLELALIGRNLINDQRIEFAGEPMSLYFRNDVEQSIWGQIKYYF